MYNEVPQTGVRRNRPAHPLAAKAALLGESQAFGEVLHVDGEKIAIRVGSDNVEGADGLAPVVRLIAVIAEDRLRVGANADGERCGDRRVRAVAGRDGHRMIPRGGAAGNRAGDLAAGVGQSRG